MAIILQKQLFGWQEIDELGDLQRLLLVVNHLPDEKLMKKLEQERCKGRNDYPIRAVWNSILAGIIYQHPSIESLRRELLRNGQLREICGFDLCWGERAVPPAYVYTRFCRKLMIYTDEVEKIFLRLVDETKTLLPDFKTGSGLENSKAINSLARGPKRHKQ